MKYVMKKLQTINETQLQQLAEIDRKRTQLLARLRNDDSIVKVLSDLSMRRNKIINEKIDTWIYVKNP